MQVSEGYGQHHKDKAATLHVVPEYDDEDDDEALVASAYSGALARNGAISALVASAAVQHSTRSVWSG